MNLDLEVLRTHVKKGDKVSEWYNGENGDILLGLSDIVSDSGIVYGLDIMNPFMKSEYHHELSKRENVKLLRTKIPHNHHHVTNLDAVVIRGFGYAFQRESFDEAGKAILKPNPDVYESLDKSLKVKGNFILYLNEFEQQSKDRSLLYDETIKRFMPNFSKICDEKYVRVYRKK